MASKRVTIQDVAKQAEVSITTVSRYLNGRYEAMSEETRNRIKAVIEALNYQPNALAQGLKGNKSKMVAVIVVNVGYPFCVSLIRALSGVFSPAGYNLLVCETGGEAEREGHILNSLMAQQVDGMIIQTNGSNNEMIAQIARQIPVVLVDRQFSIPGTTCVVTNNKEASANLTDAIFRAGYQSILYVTEVEENISTRVERLAGYQTVCEERRVNPWVGWVNRSEPSSFSELVDNLRANPPQSPFAIYTANGLIMMELYPLIRQFQLDLSCQVGVATFDEPDWVKLVTPSLTCVRQPVQKIGELAAKAVLTLLKRRTKIRTQKVQIIESALVLGDSTDLNAMR